MSFASLHIGASSLYAAQRAAELAAHNVANANTPGYTRQRLEISTAVPTPGTAGMRGDGMRGNGVTVLSVDRLRDLMSDMSFRNDAAASGSADARADVLSRVEGVLGSYPDGAPAALDRLFAAFEQLNRTPQDPAARAGVLSAGREVAASLGGAAAQLDQARADIGERMRASVEEVNVLAAQVADLNLEIADAVNSAQSPNDLLDRRDLALDRLATLTGATVRRGENSQVDVLVGGAPLVTGTTSRSLAVTTTPAGYGTTFTDDGSPATTGGQLGALGRAANLELPSFTAQLDEVAAALASRFNEVHARGYGLDGDPAAGPDGGDFFSGTTAATLQVRAGLTERGLAASASGSPADGNHALELAGLREGAPSLGDLLRGVGSRLGAAAASSGRDAKTASAALTGSEQRRASANGVNVDEEMVDLVKFQHQYQAAARVISMADGFFDTIINRMGAGR